MTTVTYFSRERKKSVKAKTPQLFSYFGKKKNNERKKEKIRKIKEYLCIMTHIQTRQLTVEYVIIGNIDYAITFFYWHTYIVLK
jgi:hypothetical protein